MIIRKKMCLIILLSVLFVSNLFAQTPPARTWFYNDIGVKTEVKERWDEDADGFKHGKYILYGYNCGWSRKYYVDEVGYYSHGKKDGVWKYFSCAGDGEIYITGTYKNDVKIGIWKEIYDSKEQIYQEGTYLNGKRNGVWINTDNTQTKKGYKVIYNNDEVISVYDDKGVNLLEAQKQNEEKVVLDNKVESDFNKCKTIEDFKKFRIIYPNSKFDNEALASIKRNEELAYVQPLISKWDSLNFTEKSTTYFDSYKSKYPNGIKMDKVNYLLDKYNKEAQEREALKVQLNNCNNSFCLYLMTNTFLKEEAQQKIPSFFNAIKFSEDGKKFSEELMFSYSIAIELKAKYGVEFFRYLNYDDNCPTSYQLLKDYPNIQTYNSDLNKNESVFNKRKFFYETVNGKIKEIIYENPSPHSTDKMTTYSLEFNKEGWLETFKCKYLYVDGGLSQYTTNDDILKWKTDIITFDKYGNVKEANCSNNLKN